MNYYFLTEDEKSFMKVLPRWLIYLGFPCSRVSSIRDVEKNNYILQSGRGITQLVTHVLFDTIDTIIDNPGKIDVLVVFLDAENMTVNERKTQVWEAINNKYDSTLLQGFEIVLIVLDRCFETWALGKNNLYLECEEDCDYRRYSEYYNIQDNDPSYMEVAEWSNDTIAQFHFHYLCEIFRYRNMRYSKKKPNMIAEEEYFNGIMERIEQTEHLVSFREFVDFINNEVRKIIDIDA